MQNDDDAQATPVSWTSVAAGGVGMRCTVQPAGVRRSARVVAAPARVVIQPTAVQSRADGHDTPDRKAARAAGGARAGAMAQPRARVQRAVRVRPAVPAALPAKPTAVHDVVRGHDTAAR